MPNEQPPVREDTMIGDLQMLTSAERISRHDDLDLAQAHHAAAARRPSRTRVAVGRLLRRERAETARAPQPLPRLPGLLGQPSVSRSLH